MKFNKTALGVGGFIILLIAAGYAANSRADTVHIGIGKTVINSHLKTAEVAYNREGWEASAALTEAGRTKNGRQDQLQVYSLSYITTPGWGAKGIEPYMRIGASYNSGSNLVGRTNYRLGVGVDFSSVFRVEFVHHSSAGIHEPNTGLDYVALSYTVPTPW